jgi:hypothetical protein
MASALALEHDGLRLRSRRIRSGRSHRLPLLLGCVLAVIALASAVGFVGAKYVADLQVQATPVVDAATLELQPIRAELQQNLTALGLAVSEYETGEIDRTELQRRLTDVLGGYQDAANQLDTLDVTPVLRQQYLDTLTTLTESVTELSKAYDDGDHARVARALAMSLEATGQLHDWTAQNLH